MFRYIYYLRAMAFDYLFMRFDIRQIINMMDLEVKTKIIKQFFLT